MLREDISDCEAHEDGLLRDAEKLAWIGNIQGALAGDRFVLHAQPIHRPADQGGRAARLLNRLRAIVGPGAFLPIAERYFDRGHRALVIEKAAALAATGCLVETNVSARSFGDPAVIDHIERCLQTSGADPSLMVFEVTETAHLEDQAPARTFAERIHALGSRPALYDFGTGSGPSPTSSTSRSTT